MFNVNDPLLVANVVVTGITLWGMAVASMPWAVGIVARTFVGKLCGSYSQSTKS